MIVGLVGSTLTGFSSWPSGVTKTTDGTTTFAGGILYATSKIWLVPETAPWVISIATTTGVMTKYDSYPVGFTKSNCDFFGGASDGVFTYMVPRRGDQLLRLQESNAAMTAYTLPAMTTNGFLGSAYLSPYHWLYPSKATAFVRVTASSGSMTAYSAWPAGFSNSNEGFAGGSFDGTRIWLAPYLSTNVVVFHIGTQAMWLVQTWSQPTVVGPQEANKFMGAVFDGDQIWLVPFNARRVARLRSVSRSFTMTLRITHSLSEEMSWTRSLSKAQSATSTPTPTPSMTFVPIPTVRQAYLRSPTPTVTPPPTRTATPSVSLSIRSDSATKSSTNVTRTCSATVSATQSFTVVPRPADCTASLDAASAGQAAVLLREPSPVVLSAFVGSSLACGVTTEGATTVRIDAERCNGTVAAASSTANVTLLRADGRQSAVESVPFGAAAAAERPTVVSVEAAAAQRSPRRTTAGGAART